MKLLKIIGIAIPLIIITAGLSYPDSLIMYTLKKNYGGFLQDVTHVKEKENQFQYVLYNDLKETDVTHMTSFLESNYQRILQDLNVSSLPLVTVRIWKNYEDFHQEQENSLGQRYIGSMGYITWAKQPELKLMYREGDDGAISMVHEFAHIASLAINSTIANNPRWLWEAIAIYEAGKLKVPPSQIEYIAARDFPTIEELSIGYNRDGEERNIYQVGYVLGEFIDSKWGAGTLSALIKSNGNIQETLKVPVPEFEASWHKFIQNRYLKEK